MKRVTGLILILLLGGTLGAQQKRIYNDGEIDYAPVEAEFVLSADELSENLDYIEYTINGGEWNQYTEPIGIVDEGRHFITYRAGDIAGNSSRENVYTVVIDSSPPRLSASAIGAAHMTEDETLYLRSDSAIVLEAADRLSGAAAIFVSTDNEEFRRYTGPVYFADEGEQSGYAYGVDNVGNRTETFQSTAIVDDTAPAVSLLPSRPFRTFGGERYSEPGTRILVRANDRLSGVARVEVSVNGQPFRRYTEPIEVDTSGFYSIRGRAVDHVGNTSRPQEVSFYLGVETPEPSIEPRLE